MHNFWRAKVAASFEYVTEMKGIQIFRKPKRYIL